MGTFLAIVGAFVGYANARKNNSTIIDEAAAAGLIIAVPIAARKKLPSMYRSVAKAICDIPRDSIMLYYLKEYLTTDKNRYSRKTQIKIKISVKIR